MFPRFLPALRRFLPTVLLVLAIVLISAHFTLNLLRNGQVFLSGEAYSRYEERRPYQYRLLMAPVMRGLMRKFSEPQPGEILAASPAYLSTPELAAYFVIDVVSLSLSYLLVIAIARRVFGAATARWVIAVYIAMTYSFFCLNPNLAFILPYDIPSLAFSQACILAVLASRWKSLYLLFALATLNRETSFLIIIFIAATASNQPGRSLRPVVHIAALSAMWLSMKIGLQLAFSHLPIDGGERVTYNLQELSKPWQWAALMPLIMSFGLTLFTLRRVSPQPQWAITGCIGFGMFFLVAQLTETRSYADLTVYFSMAIGSWLADSESRERTRQLP